MLPLTKKRHFSNAFCKNQSNIVWYTLLYHICNCYVTRGTLYRLLLSLSVGTCNQLRLFIMGKRCIVAGCSNISAPNISLHQFPSVEPFRRLWINFVKQTRSNWKEPSVWSTICSVHFTEECFIRNDIATSLGFGKRLV